MKKSFQDYIFGLSNASSELQLSSLNDLLLSAYIHADAEPDPQKRIHIYQDIKSVFEFANRKFHDDINPLIFNADNIKTAFDYTINLTNFIRRKQKMEPMTATQSNQPVVEEQQVQNNDNQQVQGTKQQVQQVVDTTETVVDNNQVEHQEEIQEQEVSQQVQQVVDTTETVVNDNHIEQKEEIQEQEVSQQVQQVVDTPETVVNDNHIEQKEEAQEEEQKEKEAQNPVSQQEQQAVDTPTSDKNQTQKITIIPQEELLLEQLSEQEQPKVDETKQPQPVDKNEKLSFSERIKKLDGDIDNLINEWNNKAVGIQEKIQTYADDYDSSKAKLESTNAKQTELRKQYIDLMKNLTDTNTQIKDSKDKKEIQTLKDRKKQLMEDRDNIILNNSKVLLDIDTFKSNVSIAEYNKTVHERLLTMHNSNPDNEQDSKNVLNNMKAQLLKLTQNNVFEKFDNAVKEFAGIQNPRNGKSSELRDAYAKLSNELTSKKAELDKAQKDYSEAKTQDVQNLAKSIYDKIEKEYDKLCIKEYKAKKKEFNKVKREERQALRSFKKIEREFNKVKNSINKINKLDLEIAKKQCVIDGLKKMSTDESKLTESTIKKIKKEQNKAEKAIKKLEKAKNKQQNKITKANTFFDKTIEKLLDKDKVKVNDNAKKVEVDYKISLNVIRSKYTFINEFAAEYDKIYNATKTKNNAKIEKLEKEIAKFNAENKGDSFTARMKKKKLERLEKKQENLNKPSLISKIQLKKLEKEFNKGFLKQPLNIYVDPKDVINAIKNSYDVDKNAETDIKYAVKLDGNNQYRGRFVPDKFDNCLPYKISDSDYIYNYDMNSGFVYTTFQNGKKDTHNLAPHDLLFTDKYPKLKGSYDKFLNLLPNFEKISDDITNFVGTHKDVTVGAPEEVNKLLEAMKQAGNVNLSMLDSNPHIFNNIKTTLNNDIIKNYLENQDNVANTLCQIITTVKNYVDASVNTFTQLCTASFDVIEHPENVNIDILDSYIDNQTLAMDALNAAFNVAANKEIENTAENKEAINVTELQQEKTQQENVQQEKEANNDQVVETKQSQSPEHDTRSQSSNNDGSNNNQQPINAADLTAELQVLVPLAKALSQVLQQDEAQKKTTVQAMKH